MENSGYMKRMTAWMMVFILALATVFHNGTAVQAASAKHVKSVVLKIGSRKVNRKTYKLEEGKKVTLKASASPAGAKKKVEFKSQKTVIATVSKKGRVTAKSTGTSKITVTVTGKDGQKKRTWVKIKVTKAAQAVTAQQSGTTERSGGSGQSGTTERSGGSGQSGTTERAGGSGQSGTTEQAGGSGQQDATEYQDSTEELPSDPEVLGVEIRADQREIYVGMSEKLTAVLLPEGAQSSVTWESGDPEIAVVDAKGFVTGRKAGRAKITCTTGSGRKASIIITVSKIAVTGVKLDQKGELKLNAGASAPLKAVVTPANATDRTVRWESSNEEIARVDADGFVTAGDREGTAVITVTTNDMEFTAGCTVVVSEVNEDAADGIQAGIANSLKGFEGVVLAGTDAELVFRVTANGALLKNQHVHVSMEAVSGYTGYYELSSSEADTGEDGTGIIYVRLKEKYRQIFGALLYSGSQMKPAYASFRLNLTVGRDKEAETVSVSFGQVIPATQYGLKHGASALTVDNHYDPLIKPLDPPGGSAVIGISENEDGYPTQYVTAQQVSSKTDALADHKVYLDAAPLLCCALGSGEEPSDVFERKVAKGQTDYTVYQDADAQDAVLIENVPGRLQYLNLTFGAFQLSRYTRLVIRAYQPGKMEPVVSVQQDGTLALAEKVFDASYLVESGESLSVGQEIFAATKDMDNVDLRIFVESAGQVDAGNHGGFRLTKLAGKYVAENRKPYELRRIDNAVTWEAGSSQSRQGSRLMEAEEARQALGANYYGDHNYYVSLPNYPDTGNAVIKEYDRKKNIVGYYLYPTIVSGSQNVLMADSGGLCADYLRKVSKNAVQALEEKDYSFKADATAGRAVIESFKEGYVPVRASIALGETGNEVAYSVSSYVQWLPVPEKNTDRINDFYALAGQRMKVTATFTDSDGNIPEASEVSWRYYDKGANISVALKDVLNELGVTVHWMDEKTDSDGVAVLELSSDQPLDLERITAVATGCRVSYAVRHHAVMTDGLRMHWILPGIRYQNEPGGIEVNTTDEAELLEAARNMLKQSPGEYDTLEKWILGAQVVGKTADSQTVVKRISGLELAAAAEGESEVTVTEIDSGVWSLSGRGKGLSTLTVSLKEAVEPETEENQDGESGKKTGEGTEEKTEGSTRAEQTAGAGGTTEEEQPAGTGGTSETATGAGGTTEEERPAGTGGTSETATGPGETTEEEQSTETEGNTGMETTKMQPYFFEIERDGKIETYENMGEGEFLTSAIEIPMRWTVSGANLRLINRNPVYDVDNAIKGKDASPHIYVQVLGDDLVSAVEDVELTMNISSIEKGKLVTDNVRADGKAAAGDQAEEEVKTDARGLYDIDLSRYADILTLADDTIVVSVYITADGKGQSQSTKVAFVKNEGSFSLIPEAEEQDSSETAGEPASKEQDSSETAGEPASKEQDLSETTGEPASKEQDPSETAGESAEKEQDPSETAGKPAMKKQKPIEITVNPETKVGIITLSFNREMDASILTGDELSGFIKVQDEDGEEVKTFEAGVPASNPSQVVITVPDCRSEQMTVRIEPEYAEEGQVHLFLNREGILYSDEAGTQGKKSKTTGSRSGR